MSDHALETKTELYQPNISDADLARLGARVVDIVDPFAAAAIAQDGDVAQVDIGDIAAFRAGLDAKRHNHAARIDTREPDDEVVEVGIEGLKSFFDGLNEARVDFAATMDTASGDGKGSASKLLADMNTWDEQLRRAQDEVLEGIIGSEEDIKKWREQHPEKWQAYLKLKQQSELLWDAWDSRYDDAAIARSWLVSWREEQEQAEAETPQDQLRLIDEPAKGTTISEAKAAKSVKRQPVHINGRELKLSPTLVRYFQNVGVIAEKPRVSDDQPISYELNPDLLILAKISGSEAADALVNPQALIILMNKIAESKLSVARVMKPGAPRAASGDGVYTFAEAA